MKKIILVLLLSISFLTNAQVTQVSGNQSGTWSGEVHIVGDVMVQNSDALTVAPGTSVIADGYFGIMVLGSMYALGEENSRITFTVADTTGYSNFNDIEAGAWKGITYSKANEVRLEYCDFSYGKTDLNSDGGAIRAYLSSSFEISQCTFHHNTARRRGGAIYAENSIINIHDCEIYENSLLGYEGSYCWGTGFHFLKCSVNSHDMVFHDNFSDVGYGGGMNIDSCNMELNNAVFYNNITVNAGGLGIQRCQDYTVKVSNMLAYNNVVKHYGGGLAIATSSPELNNLTIVNNYCGAGGAGMQNAFAAAPILSNCIFWDNHAVYNTNSSDTVEYYMGSQIWLWGSDCRPTFINGDIQYGLDSIEGCIHVTPDHYVNMIDADPLFVSADINDYRLSSGSPCIDAGTPDISGMFLPDTDLGGGPRVYNNRIDMGCYEWYVLNVNENMTNNNNISVYPNPLNDNAYCVVNLAKKTDVVLKLMTIDGKEIYRENCGIFGAGEHKIPLDGMMKYIEKGNKMYLLVVDNQYVKIVY